MATAEELQARMAAGYDRLGMPSWPDPHPDREPRDEEYSRVTEPERYRIVHARARAWTTQLRGLPDVEVQEVTAGPVGDGRHEFDRGVRISCTRPGTLSLLLLERDVSLPEHDAPLAVLHIGVARPDVIVDMQPDCGCDACDCGSSDLLSAIDEAIKPIVAGPFVAVRGPGWQAEWHPDGGGAGGTPGHPGFDRLMALCRRLADGEDVRLPPSTEAFVGRSWFS